MSTTLLVPKWDRKLQRERPSYKPKIGQLFLRIQYHATVFIAHPDLQQQRATHSKLNPLPKFLIFTHLPQNPLPATAQKTLPSFHYTHVAK